MSHSVTLTWTPSQTDITEIVSYTIYRGVDGATPTVFLVCRVLRDFLGGIIGVQHCTTTHSPDDDTGDVVTDGWIEDAPISYVDTTVAVGHTYCYYVTAQPLGNNQAVAQGPPSAPSNLGCVAIGATATTPVLAGQVINNDAVVLTWSASTIEGSTIAGYEVFKSTDGGAFSLLTTTGDVLTYEDDAVVINHTYSYFVVAVPLVGIDSLPSNIVTESLRQFLTSRIYPVEVIEQMSGGGGQILPAPQFPTLEKMTSGGGIVSGHVDATLVTYGDGAAESIKNGGAILSGHVDLGLIGYSDGVAESITNGGGITSGHIDLGLITYTNWPAEAITSTGGLISGTLT